MMRIATGVLFAIATSACVGSWWRGDYGEPLKEFEAEHGKYFPEFVYKFFDGAKDFAREEATMAEAAEGIRLIQVKPLNPDPSNVNEANLSWSADGVYLSFELENFNQRKILVKDLSNNYSRELIVVPKGRDNFLAGHVPASLESYNAGLSWSRDSTRFAFMSNGGVGEYNIYVGAIGVKEKPVAKSPTKDGYANWSPTESELAFVSGRSGQGDIYVLNLESNKLRRISKEDGVDLFPEWFPGGDKLAFSSGEATRHKVMIAEKTFDGSWLKPWALTNTNRDILRPTVSPDGKYLAFYGNEGHSERRDLWNIHVVPYEKKRTYTDEELDEMVVAKGVVVDLNTGPAWSPDSSKIFYVKKDSNLFNPICGYDLFTGRGYILKTNTKMNRDLLISRIGILSFRAQVGAWDRVFVALTNQGLQLQKPRDVAAKIHYLKG